MDNESATCSKGRFLHVFHSFDTFIKADGFESLTQNDATGGAHLLRPTTMFLYWQQICV